MRSCVIAICSKSREIKSEITGDKGELIGVLKTCLEIILLNEKNVELKINLIINKNSSFGM